MTNKVKLIATRTRSPPDKQETLLLHVRTVINYRQK